MPTIHFNQLSEAEQERLAILAEECGEVIQAVGKILRHGYESTSPFVANPPTNRQTLEHEIGDVLFAVGQLDGEGDLDSDAIMDHAKAKAASVEPYLHHHQIRWEPEQQEAV